MLRRKRYTTRREKLIDLIIGVGVFIVVSSIMGGVSWGLTTLANNLPFSSSKGTFQDILYWVPLLLPTLVNLGLMVLLAFWRHWIALGMLATFGVLLAISLCLTVVVWVLCLIALQQSGF